MTTIPDPSPSAERPRLLRAAEVAELLNGVPVSTVHAWARSGYLPSLKLGRHRRFDPSAVAAWIARHGAGR